MKIGKRFEKNNPTIVLNTVYIKGKIGPAYMSKINSNCEKEMISNEKEQIWQYLAVKKLSALLLRITSKHNGDFYCLNCLYSLRTEKKLNLIKKYIKIKIFVEL